MLESYVVVNCILIYSIGNHGLSIKIKIPTYYYQCSFYFSFNHVSNTSPLPTPVNCESGFLVLQESDMNEVKGTAAHLLHLPPHALLWGWSGVCGEVSDRPIKNVR